MASAARKTRRGAILFKIRNSVALTPANPTKSTFYEILYMIFFFFVTWVMQPFDLHIIWKETYNFVQLYVKSLTTRTGRSFPSVSEQRPDQGAFYRVGRRSEGLTSDKRAVASRSGCFASFGFLLVLFFLLFVCVLRSYSGFLGPTSR